MDFSNARRTRSRPVSNNIFVGSFNFTEVESKTSEASSAVPITSINEDYFVDRPSLERHTSQVSLIASHNRPNEVQRSPALGDFKKDKTVKWDIDELRGRSLKKLIRPTPSASATALHSKENSNKESQRNIQSNRESEPIEKTINSLPVPSISIESPILRQGLAQRFPKQSENQVPFEGESTPKLSVNPPSSPTLFEDFLVSNPAERFPLSNNESPTRLRLPMAQSSSDSSAASSFRLSFGFNGSSPSTSKRQVLNNLPSIFIQEAKPSTQKIEEAELPLENIYIEYEQRRKRAEFSRISNTSTGFRDFSYSAQGFSSFGNKEISEEQLSDLKRKNLVFFAIVGLVFLKLVFSLCGSFSESFDQES